MSDVESKCRLKIVDNVFVKMHQFAEIGDTLYGHVHTFDHITLLATGAVTMKHDKGVEEFVAPHLIVTPKGIAHEFVATQVNTILCCIHAIRDGDEIDDVAPQEITQEQASELLAKFPIVS